MVNRLTEPIKPHMKIQLLQGGTRPRGRPHCASFAHGETGTRHDWSSSLETLLSITLLCILIFGFGIKLMFPDTITTEGLDGEKPTSINVSMPCNQQSKCSGSVFDRASCFTLSMIKHQILHVLQISELHSENYDASKVNFLKADMQLFPHIIRPDSKYLSPFKYKHVNWNTNQ